jgi:hypothetical protein
MSNSNKHPLYREGRIGGFAGEGGAHKLSPIELEAIDTANRRRAGDGHDITGAAVKYGTEPVINLHTGEIAQRDLDAGLRGHPHDLEQHKDER